MAEFKDGNLFFEIMQQEIWNKAQMDTVAQLALYEKNKKNYTWNQSADAVLFFCADEATAKKVVEEIKKNPADWRSITARYSEKVAADSSRYEWSQLPNLNKAVPKAGTLTSPVVNTNDNTVSFAYVFQAYAEPLPRSFQEAKGLVISDHQAILEKEWTAALKKKYPVVIDNKVLAAISK
jgi:peptidyl-prolyl cis-trans isomerase SurA